MTRGRRRACDERGQAIALELVLTVPVVLALVLTVTYLGRLTNASQQLHDVAQRAARAASLEADPESGLAAAHAAVSSSFVRIPCRGAPTVEVGWQPGPGGAWPGGVVTAEVACRVPNASLAWGWVPGERTLRGADRQVVDRFREAA